MIVPSARLIRWTAAAGVPLALAAAARPAWAAATAWAAAGLAAMAVVDAARGWPRMRRRVEVRLPPLIRLAHRRPGTLAAEWSAPPGLAVIAVAAAWPPEMGVERDEGRLRAGSNGAGLAEWDCRPRRRGRFRLTDTALAAASPWGLWELRRRCPVETDIHIMPDLRDEMRRSPANFLPRGAHGVRRRRWVGRGREFEKLREYVPGDATEDIHWKSTARRRHPVTKVYQIERTQEIYVAIDASRLSARPAPGARGGDAPPPTVLDRMLVAALMLIAAAREQGDRFGLIVYDRRIRRFLPAGHGAGHIHLCRRTLFDLEPEPVSADPAELFSFLRSRLRKRVLAVVLTSLDDAAAARAFQQAVDLAARQHLVMAFTIRPPSAAPLFSGPPPASVDDIYLRFDGYERWRRIEELRRALGRRGVMFEAIENERWAAGIVGRYLDAKQRQLL